MSIAMSKIGALSAQVSQLETCKSLVADGFVCKELLRKNGCQSPDVIDEVINAKKWMIDIHKNEAKKSPMVNLGELIDNSWICCVKFPTTNSK